MTLTVVLGQLSLALQRWMFLNLDGNHFFQIIHINRLMQKGNHSLELGTVPAMSPLFLLCSSVSSVVGLDKNCCVHPKYQRLYKQNNSRRAEVVGQTDTQQEEEKTSQYILLLSKSVLGQVDDIFIRHIQHDAYKHGADLAG